MKRIALIDNCGSDFYNYRVPLAKYLMDSGYEVFAIVPEDSFTEKIKKSGLKTLNYSFARNSLNFPALIKTIKQLKKLNREYNFDIVHSFRLQPNVFCNISFGRNKNIKVINHITGLGYSFSNNSIKALFYRFIILTLYQSLLIFSDRIICQNNDDKAILSKLAGISGKISLIEGSGIDIKFFSRINVNNDIIKDLISSLSIQPENIVVTFVGRLLLEKGIREFIEAAKSITKINSKAIFIIIGWIDNGNPSYISRSEINNLKDFSNIFFLEKREDVKELLFISDIFVLPTYREGFSRSILEAMAMELAVITTDVPGARDAVQNDFNGIIVKPGNVSELKDAIENLIVDSDKRERMGQSGRELLEKYFSSDVVFNKINKIYHEILDMKKQQ